MRISHAEVAGELAHFVRGHLHKAGTDSGDHDALTQECTAFLDQYVKNGLMENLRPDMGDPLLPNGEVDRSKIPLTDLQLSEALAMLLRETFDKGVSIGERLATDPTAADERAVVYLAEMTDAQAWVAQVARR